MVTAKNEKKQEKRPFPYITMRVSSGPSREALFDALRLGLEPDRPGPERTVSFVRPAYPSDNGDNPVHVFFLVRGIKDDGTPETAYTPKIQRDGCHWIVLVSSPDESEWWEIQYDTIKRVGWAYKLLDCKACKESSFVKNGTYCSKCGKLHQE